MLTELWNLLPPGRQIITFPFLTSKESNSTQDWSSAGLAWINCLYAHTHIFKVCFKWRIAELCHGWFTLQKKERIQGVGVWERRFLEAAWNRWPSTRKDERERERPGDRENQRNYWWEDIELPVNVQETNDEWIQTGLSTKASSSFLP